MDSSRPVIRSSEPTGPPPSLQDKDKFKQESKAPTAPKKVQVGVKKNKKQHFFQIISCTSFSSLYMNFMCWYLAMFLIGSRLTIDVAHLPLCVCVCVCSGCETEEYGLVGQPGTEVHIYALICSEVIEWQFWAVPSCCTGEGGEGESPESPSWAGRKRQTTQRAGQTTVRNPLYWVHVITGCLEDDWRQNVQKAAVFSPEVQEYVVYLFN